MFDKKKQFNIFGLKLLQFEGLEKDYIKVGDTIEFKLCLNLETTNIFNIFL